MGCTRGSSTQHVCTAKSKAGPSSNNHVTWLVASALLCLALLVQAAVAEQADSTPHKLGQRLVRRNFLRFGKRSGPPPLVMDNVKRSSAPHEGGEGEKYEASVMNGQHPHKSNTRSFLRFGKRRDNFLRFGRSPMHEVLQDYSPFVVPDSVTPYYPSQLSEQDEGDSWESRLLKMLSRINQGDVEDDDDYPQGPEPDTKLRHQQEQLFNQYAEKKANDFLRFGRA